MLWRMPVDPLEQRIDIMHPAQLSLDDPSPATRVSATNVFHRSKRTALTALTALTPAMGRPSGTRDWHSGSGNCGNPYRRPAPGNRHRRDKWRFYCVIRQLMAERKGFETSIPVYPV